MTSNVAFERSFAELSNGHEFSIVSFHLSKHYQNKLFRFFFVLWLVPFFGLQDAKKLLILHLASFSHTGSDVYDVTDTKSHFFSSL